MIEHVCKACGAVKPATEFRVHKFQSTRLREARRFEDKLKLARLLNFRYWNIVNKKQRVKNNACN